MPIMEFFYQSTHGRGRETVYAYGNLHGHFTEWLEHVQTVVYIYTLGTGLIADNINCQFCDLGQNRKT